MEPISRKLPLMPRRPALTLALLPALVAAAAIWPSLQAGTREALAESGSSADTFFLTDEPGNWFRSDATGTPVSFVPERARASTSRSTAAAPNTRHTVTLLVKPVGSQTEIDQDQSQNGTLSAEFDLPGVYILHCKVHAYMTAVVGGDRRRRERSRRHRRLVAVHRSPGGSVAARRDVCCPWSRRSRPPTPTSRPSGTSSRAGARIIPPVPGVGEVWVNAQFERVPDQRRPRRCPQAGHHHRARRRDIHGRARDQRARRAAGGWNNPHNMWANFRARHRLQHQLVRQVAQQDQPRHAASS